LQRRPELRALTEEPATASQLVGFFFFIRYVNFFKPLILSWHEQEKVLRRQNQRQRKKGGQQKSQSNFSSLNQVAGVPEKKKHHSDLPVSEPKVLTEPGTICPVCGKKIDNIGLAFANASGEYVHFDCVLDSLKATHKLAGNQTISYIGTGNFAICEKGEDGKYTIVERIPYESSEQTNRLRSFIEENRH
jgi:hypothetical protein